MPLHKSLLIASAAGEEGGKGRGGKGGKRDQQVKACGCRSIVNGLNRQYMGWQGYNTLTIIKRVLTEKIDLCGSSVD